MWCVGGVGCGVCALEIGGRGKGACVGGCYATDVGCFRPAI